MKRSWIPGLVLCSVCLAGAAPQRAAVDSGSYVIEKNVMVPMRDGVLLRLTTKTALAKAGGLIMRAAVMWPSLRTLVAGTTPRGSGT